MSASAESLSSRVVFGAITNVVFAVAGGLLTFLQFMLVVRLAGPEQIGLFAIASAVSATMESLSDFGFADSIIRHDPEHLHDAYSTAASLHLLLSLALFVLTVLAAPFVARVYRYDVLTALVVAVSYAAFAGFCRLPLSLLGRELRFFEQRLLIFVGKVAGFVVAAVLVWYGFGVWSLIAAGAAAMVATCLPAWFIAPIRPRWLLRKQGARPLIGFAWPLWAGRMTAIVVQQGTILVISAFLTQADVGRYKAAEQIVFFLISIDVILGQTLFPALCKIRDASARVSEAFNKASRASMVWIAFAGVALCVFPDAVVRYGFSDRWEGAQLFLAAQGLAFLIGGIAYSWGYLFEVRGLTRPILYVMSAFAASWLFAFVPLVAFFGAGGAAAGVVAICAAGLGSRAYFLKRYDTGVSVFDIGRRAFGAAVVAAVPPLLLRVTPGWSLTPAHLCVELTIYVSVYAALLLRLERSLFGEVLAVLLHRRAMARATSQA